MSKLYLMESTLWIPIKKSMYEETALPLPTPHTMLDFRIVSTIYIINCSTGYMFLAL